MENDTYDVIVIGAGFCGISCGAGLKTFGISNFIILERGDSPGYFWKSCTYDRLHLHTPYHDLPYDKGLVYKYPKYKNKLQVVSYLQSYSNLYNLSSKIRLNSDVININKTNNDSLWSITYSSTLSNTTNTIKSKYLCVATSLFREALIPENLLNTMKDFNGTIMHSINYKNGKDFVNKNVFVIGNGNSACEICIDLVEYNANNITMCSRRPRHFTPLKTFDCGLFRQMLFAKYLGKWDPLHSTKLYNITKKHPAYAHVIADSEKKYGKNSMDLSKYGIIKPVLSSTEETFEGSYEVIDIGCIPLIKNGRINIVNCGGVAKFDGNNIYMENNEILSNYDVVILCTGFTHGLQKLFDKDIFNKYFYDGINEKCELYPRYKIFPKTNGFNKSLTDDSLYFLSFDSSLTGGLGRGIWGFEIARQISKKEKIYKKNMELSHWNYMNTLVWSGIVVASVVVVGTVSFSGWYIWKNKSTILNTFKR